MLLSVALTLLAIVLLAVVAGRVRGKTARLLHMGLM